MGSEASGSKVASEAAKAGRDARSEEEVAPGVSGATESASPEAPMRTMFWAAHPATDSWPAGASAESRLAPSQHSASAPSLSCDPACAPPAVLDSEVPISVEQYKSIVLELSASGLPSLASLPTDPAPWPGVRAPPPGSSSDSRPSASQREGTGSDIASLPSVGKDNSSPFSSVLTQQQVRAAAHHEYARSSGPRASISPIPSSRRSGDSLGQSLSSTAHPGTRNASLELRGSFTHGSSGSWAADWSQPVPDWGPDSGSTLSRKSSVASGSYFPHSPQPAGAAGTAGFRAGPEQSSPFKPPMPPPTRYGAWRRSSRLGMVAAHPLRRQLDLARRHSMGQPLDIVYEAEQGSWEGQESHSQDDNGDDDRGRRRHSAGEQQRGSRDASGAAAASGGDGASVRHPPTRLADAVALDSALSGLTLSGGGRLTLSGHLASLELAPTLSMTDFLQASFSDGLLPTIASGSLEETEGSEATVHRDAGGTGKKGSRSCERPTSSSRHKPSSSSHHKPPSSSAHPSPRSLAPSSESLPSSTAPTSPRSVSRSSRGSSLASARLGGMGRTMSLPQPHLGALPALSLPRPRAGLRKRAAGGGAQGTAARAAAEAEAARSPAAQADWVVDAVGECLAGEDGAKEGCAKRESQWVMEPRCSPKKDLPSPDPEALGVVTPRARPAAASPSASPAFPPDTLPPPLPPALDPPPPCHSSPLRAKASVALGDSFTGLDAALALACRAAGAAGAALVACDARRQLLLRRAGAPPPAEALRAASACAGGAAAGGCRLLDCGGEAWAALAPCDARLLSEAEQGGRGEGSGARASPPDSPRSPKTLQLQGVLLHGPGSAPPWPAETASAVEAAAALASFQAAAGFALSSQRAVLDAADAIYAQARRLMDAHAAGAILIDVTRPSWPLTYADPRVGHAAGTASVFTWDDDRKPSFWSMFGVVPDDHASVQNALLAIEQRTPFTLRVVPRLAQARGAAAAPAEAALHPPVPLPGQAAPPAQRPAHAPEAVLTFVFRPADLSHLRGWADGLRRAEADAAAAAPALVPAPPPSPRAGASAFGPAARASPGGGLASWQGAAPAPQTPAPQDSPLDALSPFVSGASSVPLSPFGEASGAGPSSAGLVAPGPPPAAGSAPGSPGARPPPPRPASPAASLPLRNPFLPRSLDDTALFALRGCSSLRDLVCVPPTSRPGCFLYYGVLSKPATDDGARGGPASRAALAAKRDALLRAIADSFASQTPALTLEQLGGAAVGSRRRRRRGEGAAANRLAASRRAASAALAPPRGVDAKASAAAAAEAGTAARGSSSARLDSPGPSARPHWRASAGRGFFGAELGALDGGGGGGAAPRRRRGGAGALARSRSQSLADRSSASSREEVAARVSSPAGSSAGGLSSRRHSKALGGALGGALAVSRVPSEALDGEEGAAEASGVGASARPSTAAGAAAEAETSPPASSFSALAKGKQAVDPEAPRRVTSAFSATSASPLSARALASPRSSPGADPGKTPRSARVSGGLFAEASALPPPPRRAASDLPALPPSDSSKSKLSPPGQRPLGSWASTAPAPARPSPPPPPTPDSVSVIAQRPQVMREVTLGPLIGVGSSGRAYGGQWYGARVAVKIVECWMAREDDAVGLARARTVELAAVQNASAAVVEAALGRALAHPHVVPTYAFGSVDGETDASGRVHHAIWIVQAYCNRGTLLGAIEKREFFVGDGQGPGGGGGRANKGAVASAPPASSAPAAASSPRATANEDAPAPGAAASPPAPSQHAIAVARAYSVLPQLLPLNLRAVLVTAVEVVGAMAYLHSFGVLHGDLTGNNVLLTASSKDMRRWTTAVADFGLSRFAGASLHSAPYGTVTHMPPEVLAGAPLSPPSDVWSFGTLLWEMLSGCRAWGWLSYHQVLHAAATHTPLPMDHLALLSPELRRIVTDCLAIAPAGRPSFEQLLQRLTKILKDVARKAQGDQARREA